MKTTLYIILPAFFFLAACNQGDDAPTGEPPPAQYATVEVTVKRCADAACTSLVEIAGARVFFYATEQDRSDEFDVAFEGSTGSNGKLTISTLEAPEYWLLVSIPQPDGRQKEEFVRTPARTKSFVEVIFPY